MTATLHANGRARKSLADQIDRLDSVLDGLAENLNEAVAMAVTEAVTLAVRQAVAAVLTEMIKNPAVLAALRSAVQPLEPAARPSTLAKIAALPVKALAWTGCLLGGVCLAGLWRYRQLRQAGARTVRNLVAGIGQSCRRGIQGLRAGWAILTQVRHLHRPLLSALSAGGAVGTSVFFSEPWMAAAVSGVLAFGTAVAIYAAITLGPLLRALVASKL